MTHRTLRINAGKATVTAHSAGKRAAAVYGVHETVFGYCLLVQDEHGIIALDFRDGEAELEASLESLKTRWPELDFMRDDKAGTAIVRRMEREGQAASVAKTSLHLKGTPFQLEVWQALLELPDGALTDYSRIAARTRNPAAIRAAASAVGDNPVAFLVPCHRVLRKDGGLGGYATGLPRKRKMLAFEENLLRARKRTA